MTRDNCKFKFYYKDQCTAFVSIEDGTVTTEKYTDDWLLLPFGKVSDRNITRRGVNLFFSEHCIPEHRANLQDFLLHYGLEKHDPFRICRITNGQMADSPYRIEWVEA
jgi:hypothetical protein